MRMLICCYAMLSNLKIQFICAVSIQMSLSIIWCYTIVVSVPIQMISVHNGKPPVGKVSAQYMLAWYLSPWMSSLGKFKLATEERRLFCDHLVPVYLLIFWWVERWSVEWSGLLCLSCSKRLSLCLSKTIKILATWLILPVVTRSSQRLSHACVSLNTELWNCEWLIISVIVYLVVSYYLDTRSNSRANTCVNTWLLEGWYLLDWNQLASAM